MKAGTITLIKHDGNLIFTVDKLEVIDSTILTLGGTDAGNVHIGTATLARGSMLTVDATFGTNNGDYTLDNLKVLAPGAKFTGELDTSDATKGSGVQHMFEAIIVFLPT